MKYEQKNIRTDELQKADYNPRQISPHDFEALKDSIQKFGFAEPLVVNGHAERNNIVIGGHQRLRAATELGFTEVPCFVVNLDKAEEMELNIRLNRNTGEFDFDALANSFEAGDLLDWGMTARELDLDDFLSEDGDEVEAPKPKEKKLDYKLTFNNESEMDEWYEFLSELKLASDDEAHPTLSQKLLHYTKQHPIQV